MNIYDIIKITDSNINKKLYNGSEKKLGVTISGKDYIMKFRKRDWNNIESEYIASNVISILGGDAHRVYLGCYRNDLVALCLDFTQFYDSSYLQSLRSISSSMFDTDKSQHDYFFNDVIYLFKSLRNCDVEYNKDKFIRMYIYDDLLGNTDRHAGNWDY